MILNDKDVLARLRALEAEVANLKDDLLWEHPYSIFGWPIVFDQGPGVVRVVKLLLEHLGLRLEPMPAKGKEWKLLQVKTPPNKRMKLTPRKAGSRSK